MGPSKKFWVCSGLLQATLSDLERELRPPYLLLGNTYEIHPYGGDQFIWDLEM